MCWGDGLSASARLHFRRQIWMLGACVISVRVLHGQVVGSSKLYRSVGLSPNVIHGRRGHPDEMGEGVRALFVSEGGGAFRADGKTMIVVLVA